MHEVKWISVEWIRVGWLRQTFCQLVWTWRLLGMAWVCFALLFLADWRSMISQYELRCFLVFSRLGLSSPLVYSILSTLLFSSRFLSSSLVFSSPLLSCSSSRVLPSPPVSSRLLSSFLLCSRLVSFRISLSSLHLSSRLLSSPLVSSKILDFLALGGSLCIFLKNPRLPGFRGKYMHFHQKFQTSWL